MPSLWSVAGAEIRQHDDAASAAIGHKQRCRIRGGSISHAVRRRRGGCRGFSTAPTTATCRFFTCPVACCPMVVIANQIAAAGAVETVYGRHVRTAEATTEERKLWQNSGRGDAPSPSSVSSASSRVHAMMMFPTLSSQLADGSISRLPRPSAAAPRRPMSHRRTSCSTCQAASRPASPAPRPRARPDRRRPVAPCYRSRRLRVVRRCRLG